MKSTTMDRFSEKQAEITHRRTLAAAEYPALWSRMISEWRRPVSEDRAWLIYAANYIFQTGGIRWAIDPLTLKDRVPDAPEVNLLPDLDRLSLILLTHRHSDHFNAGMIRALRELPARWVVPAPLLPLVEEAGLSSRKISVPRPLEPLAFDGLRITPFDGLHWEDDPAQPAGQRGVPAMGYLVESAGKRWLFPGDTRTYDVSRLPSFGAVDCLFAHLWLGRGAALHSPAPLLEPFCNFCLALHPRRIILTHLNEWGRHADELWRPEHAEEAVSVLRKTNPGLPVDIGCTGDGFRLDGG